MDFLPKDERATGSTMEVASGERNEITYEDITPDTRWWYCFDVAEA